MIRAVFAHLERNANIDFRDAATRPCRSFRRATQHSLRAICRTAIEHEGGESMIASDPGRLPCRRPPVLARLVNAQHCDISANVAMPVILYRPQEGRRQVAARLKTLRSVGATC
jgi:hypothetical protein